MAEYTIYETTENDRWDSIAYKAYGDANKASEIMLANPTVSADAILPSGIKIQVPILEDEETATNLLPPWKR